MIFLRKTLFIFLLLFGLAKSCNVPVFRYALERWDSDAYQVFVFAEGSPDSKAYQLLAKSATGIDSLSNYSLTTVDVKTEDGKRAAEAIEITGFPWLAVYYPASSQVHGLVWDGPLNISNVELLIQSPVRNQAAEKILSGDAAVWIFLKSGNETKDKSALDVLKKTLAKASDELKIPNTGVDINGNAIEVTDFVDYDVKFDFVELSRDDPKEEVLLAMLLGSESDLVYYNEPMTFPVFGRGRSLYAIIGKGINEKTVYNACRSIIAWCSCEIKEQNPGIDLLISADWSNPVGGQMVKDEELPPLTGLSEFIPQEEEGPQPGAKIVEKEKVEPAKIDTAKTEPVFKDTIEIVNVESQPTSSSLLRNLLLVVGLGLVVIITATFLLKSKFTT